MQRLYGHDRTGDNPPAQKLLGWQVEFWGTDLMCSLNMKKPRTIAGQRPPFSQRMGVGTGEIEMRSLGINFSPEMRSLFLYWSTQNEPYSGAISGYELGQ